MMIHLGRSLSGVMLAFILASSSAVAADDLLWLEEPHGERALAWARHATQQTHSRLSSLASRERIARELASVLEQKPAEPDQFLLGERAVRFMRNAAHPYGLLQVAPRNEDGGAGTWTTVLDIAELREREGVPFELRVEELAGSCLPPEYARCLLSLSPGGGGEAEVREFDLVRGRFVDGGFHVGKSRSFIEWMGPDLVLIGHTVGDAPRSMAGWPTAFQLWKRGQPLQEASTVFSGKPTDAMLGIATAGFGAMAQGVVVRSIDYSTVEISLVDAGGRSRTLPLPVALNVLATSARHILVQLTKDAVIEGRPYRAETVLAYDVSAAVPESQRVSVAYVPADGEFVDRAVSGAEQVYMIVSRNLQQRIVAMRADVQGRWLPSDLMEAEAGETLTMRIDDRGNDDLLVTLSGFVTPRSQYLVRPGRQRLLLARDPALVDAEDFVTEIGSATSRDGTSVNYFLLKPRAPASGPRPLLMTGYGAFGFSFRPAYFDRWVGGPSLKLWLDRGGALAVPVMRGGGERGAAWHQAALREKRQKSYDDFIAVTEYLIKSGTAAPAQTGVFGMSNGGLLAAVLGTQRPDLFGAVVSDVPLTDLMRMRYMGTGAAWMDEYGNPDIAAQRDAILAYSPYQNIRSGVEYPPFMVTISTEDNVVGPGHARKFAYRLMEAGVTTYFYEEEEGGHGVSDALRNPELMTLRMAFLIDTLMPAEPRGNAHAAYR